MASPFSKAAENRTDRVASYSVSRFIVTGSALCGDEIDRAELTNSGFVVICRLVSIFWDGKW